MFILGSHVSGTLKSLMKGVQANEVEIDADNLDELVEHFFQGSAPQSKKAIPNLFAMVPHFKTEREMYDHFVSTTPTTPLCP